MKHAFVTGGSGFLGLNLVEQLILAGWRVTALHRASSNLKYLSAFDVTLVEGSITDAGAVLRALPDDVDCVFHVAANTSLWSRRKAEQDADNIEGTRNLVAAALKRRARRFVQTSTWNVFGLEHDEISEATIKTGGESWVNYTLSKVRAEREVQAGVMKGLQAVILNPAHIVGKYDSRNWARMITMVARRKLPGIPPGRGSFCHAAEVARAHIAAAAQGAVGQNYLLGGTDASFVEVIGVIGELTGRKTPSRPLPAALVRAVARFQTIGAALTGREPDLTPEGASMVLSHPRIVSDRAARELGYRTIDLRHMLSESHNWLKSEGYLD
jgi:nucleoside-diphosphate-sugar epimerase